MNTALFLLSAALSAAVMWLIYRNASAIGRDKKRDFFRKYFPLAGTAFITLLALSDLIGIINYGPYKHTYLFMAVVCILSYILYFKTAGKFPDETKFSLKVILIASVLELTVFNIPSYKLLFGNYKQVDYMASQGCIENGGIRNPDGTVTVDPNCQFIVSFPDQKMQIGTIYTDVKFTGKYISYAPFEVDVMDATQSRDYRYGIITSNIIAKRPESHYQLCEFSGDVRGIRIRITAPESEKLIIGAISFNKPFPVDISYIRFTLITLISIFIYMVIKSKVMRRSFSESRSLCSFAAFAITIYSCFAAFSVLNYKLDNETWLEELKQVKGNQVTQELVDAFESGQTNLLQAPDSKLLLLNNPYDTQERDKSGINYSWDHVYYNNNYYSYYGIAPVVLLFLPYHLITGYYFPNTAAILVFSTIGICGLTMVYMSFMKKWFSKIPAGMTIIGLVILQIASGIWFSVGRADFYEIALSAGFAFITWGVYFLLESNVIGKGKISLRNIALSSLFFAISVLSRPTLVLYCIFAAILMLLAVKRAAYPQNCLTDYNKPKRIFTRSSVRYIICAFSPMVCLGLVQMAYNYVRFGTPFDFGIQYSLTINDFTNSQFHLRFSWMAIYNYLFNPPILSLEYPFVRTQFQYMNTGGYFYVDTLSTLNTSGLFFIAPPMFAYLASKRSLRTLPDKRSRIKTSALIGIPCLVIPFIIIASVWESGYAVRYMADFSFEALLGAYAVLFTIYLASQNETIKKLIRIFMCASLVWTLYVGGVQIINQAFRFQEYYFDFPEIAYSLEQLIAFWK